MNNSYLMKYRNWRYISACAIHWNQFWCWYKMEIINHVHNRRNRNFCATVYGNAHNRGLFGNNRMGYLWNKACVLSGRVWKSVKIQKVEFRSIMIFSETHIKKWVLIKKWGKIWAQSDLYSLIFRRLKQDI